VSRDGGKETELKCKTDF